MNNDRLAKSNPAPPWMSYSAPLKMGLRGCDEANWLLEDDFFGDKAAIADQIAQKARLCQSHHDIIFKSMPEAYAASEELYEMIEDNLRHYHSQQLARIEQLHPLDNAARSLAEDLCLIAPIGDATNQKWVLKAASLAFPSHWSLAEKLNHPMASIHSPVPDYDAYLEKAVDRFFNHMMIGPISKRRNWTLQIDDALHTPHRPSTPPLYAEEVGRRLHVRVETQTLRKLPHSGWIIFTIRTAIAPLERWQDNKNALTHLKEILSNFSPDMRHYRSISSYEIELHHWIDKQCASR